MILPVPPSGPGNGVTFALPGEAETVTVQAVVTLPSLRPSERAILAGALRSAIARTDGYAKGSILAMTAAPDGTVESLAGDHLRIGLHFQASRSREMLTVLEAILARPAFFPETLSADLAAVAAPRDLWDRIGIPPIAPVKDADPALARETWARVVRPERLVLAFAGADAAHMASAWSARSIAWPSIPRPNYRAEPKPLASPRGAAQIAVLEGQTLAPDADLGPTLLALTALGAGKGSVAWRALRLGRSASYRTEATLAGVTEGWRARLAFDLAPEDEAADAKGALLRGIEAMNDADLARARGYLAASLRGEAYDALFTPSGRRLGNTLPDRAYLAAYLRLKTGRLAALPPVPDTSLEELQALLRALVEGATLRFER